MQKKRCTNVQNCYLYPCLYLFSAAAVPACAARNRHAPLSLVRVCFQAQGVVLRQGWV